MNELSQVPQNVLSTSRGNDPGIAYRTKEDNTNRIQTILTNVIEDEKECSHSTNRLMIRSAWMSA